jgi:hypothetical protein
MGAVLPASTQPALPASPPPAETLRLVSAGLDHDPFSPAVADGRFDTSTLRATFAVRLTDALRATETAPPGASETQFFVEWEWTIFPAVEGPPLAVLRRLEPILPPFTTVILQDEEGIAAEHIQVESSLTWDGRDPLGSFVADGAYRYRLDARTVRIDTPGSPASAGVTAPVEVDTLTVRRNEMGLVFTWLPVATDVFGRSIPPPGYHLYRGTSGSFRPDATGHTNRIAATTSTTAVDPNATSDPRAFFYLVTAVDTQGHESGIDAVRTVPSSLPAVMGQVRLDDAPPSVALLAPDPAVLHPGSVPVSAVFQDQGSAVDPTTFTAALDGADVTASFAVAAGSASATLAALADGAHCLDVAVQDAAGNEASAQGCFTVDARPPVVSVLLTPQPNASGWNTTDVLVTLSADDGAGAGVRETRYTVDAEPEVIVGGGSAAVSVTGEGFHIIQVSASDLLGNAAPAQPVAVLIDGTPPLIAASASPAPNAAGWNNTDVSVVFSTSDLLSGLAEVSPAVEVSTEGSGQVVSGTATDLAGNTATASVTVNLDKTPPDVVLASPDEGLATNAATVPVSGSVQDANPIASVAVNGMSVPLSGSSFTTDVALGPGETPIVVTAADIAGNLATSSHTVTMDAAAPAPPVVFPARSPARSFFQVLMGTAEPGSVVEVDGGAQPASARTFDNGVFQVSVRLRLDAVNTLFLTAADAAGNRSAPTEVSIIQSRELPGPGPGEPAMVSVSAGDVQRGVAGTALADPLVVIVTDPEGSPVSGVEVTFQAVAGGGTLGGSPSAAVTTGADGRAGSALTLGPSPGRNIVLAGFEGNQNAPVEFLAEALAPRPVSETRLSGVVLDNDLRAIPGVRVSLQGTALFSVTDPEGGFLILNPPVGDGRLLEIDASGAALPGRFSNLAFEMNVLPGQENRLPRPIFLPLINEGIEVPLAPLGTDTAEVLEDRE